MTTFGKFSLAIATAVLALSGCGRRGPVDVRTASGTVSISPLTDNSVRIRVAGAETYEPEELYYTEKCARPRFRIVEDEQTVTVIQQKIRTVCDKTDGRLRFFDGDGNPLLSESEGGRKIGETRIGDTPAVSVSQRFERQAKDHQFGLGQFQDGYLDVSGLTRRLTQVNTQISIPVVISNKGYGIFWNNYGLTDFNPSEQVVKLERAEDGDGKAIYVNATSTHGNIRERRMFETFKGEFTAPEDGRYSLLLDVGQKMARKLYMEIDGEVVSDLNNPWLPPTTSVKMDLTAGTHSIVVRGSRGDSPSVGWRLDRGDTEFSSPVASALDYTVFSGNADEIVGAFRTLTGKAPRISDAALGYVHCRERYVSSADLLENARTFREKGIPVDIIVQDWQWWGRTGWNSMQFDPENYPDPQALVDSLHAMDMKLMLSVWSKIDRSSELGHRMDSLGYYIDGTDWIDFFDDDASAYYWNNFEEKLVSLGIDAWWLDATEPENDDLAGRTVGKDNLPGELYRNVYPLKVVKTAYEGLRKARPDEEPLILTRSAAAGMQRYGAVTWSGDVGNDWETLRRQIIGGLGMMSAGQPWWTYDAGGFFRPGNQYEDPDYQERMLRWIQTAVMLPVMRVHGYMSKTEPWRYDAATEEFFVKAIGDRKELFPYLRNCADRVAREDYTLMRPLVFDFPDDEEAMKQDTEYMFGPKYLVCPVLAPSVNSMTVYLPANGGGWKLLDDGSIYPGSEYVEVPVRPDAIPVFERL